MKKDPLFSLRTIWWKVLLIYLVFMKASVHSLPLLCNIAQPWISRYPKGLNEDLDLGIYLPIAVLRSFTICLLGKALYNSIMHKKHSVVFTLVSIKAFHSSRLIASQWCEVVYTFWNLLFRHPVFPAGCRWI